MRRRSAVRAYRASARVVARGFSRALPLLALAFAFAATPTRAAEPSDSGPVIYKWVDANGIAHYTTERSRVPAALRDQIHPLHPEERAASAPPSSTAPKATAGQAAPSSSASDAWARQNVPSEASGGTTPSPAPAPETRGAAPPAPAPKGTPPVSAPPSPPPSVASSPPSEGAAPPSALDQKIQALEREIADVEAELQKEISAAPAAKQGKLADDPNFRVLAQRLPKLQANLRELKKQRAKLTHEGDGTSQP